VGGTEGVDDLLDAGVLIDASLTGQRVAYAHPILFDHAVSTFLIGAGPRGVVEFIAEEPARGLFLWPGLYHYFTRLWLKEPDTFWEVFWQLQEEPDPGTRLFGRLLSTSVLVREARSMDQVLPLLTADPHAILQTLQALRVSQGGPDALWAGFLRALVDRMDETFAREVAIVTAGIVARAENDDPGQVLPGLRRDQPYVARVGPGTPQRFAGGRFPWGQATLCRSWPGRMRQTRNGREHCLRWWCTRKTFRPGILPRSPTTSRGSGRMTRIWPPSSPGLCGPRGARMRGSAGAQGTGRTCGCAGAGS